ncbi:ATP-binding protein [Vibrio alfacsensis]|uniref:ATP-binding protein n=1 Tax=Vibrio alfacsensis TaxID=1074311 RepID=UPI0040678B53
MTEKNVATKFYQQFTPNLIKQNDDGQVFMIQHDGVVKEAMPLHSRKGDKVIRKLGKRAEFRIVGSALREVREEVEAIAWDHDQPPIKNQIRYGLAPNSDTVTIDLDNGKIVQLSTKGVEILDSMPASNEDLYFERPSSQLPMVTPDLDHNDIGASLKKLHKFINTDTDTFFLLVAYMTYLMAHPKEKKVPYPILMIQGEKGAGKSFFCNNVLRGLIDPSTISAMPFPKQDDFVITINSMFLAVFDNLRKLKKAESDLLCSTATMGTVTKRTLYTTAGLTVLNLHTPLVLNGIHDFVQESDLASRCLRVNLIPMKEVERRPEQELKADLAAAMPEMFGALLKLASRALAVLPEVEVLHSARMMDYAKWLAALERVWKMPEGKLQKVYKGNVTMLMASGTVDDDLTISLKDMLKNLPKGKLWRGTPSQLLYKLQECDGGSFLPRGAAALTTKLKGQEASLNANGIYFKFGRDAERYILVSDKQIE